MTHPLKYKNKKKNPQSNRSRSRGVEDASGRFLSFHDIRCIEIMGGSVSKIFAKQLNNL